MTPHIAPVSQAAARAAQVHGLRRQPRDVGLEEWWRVVRSRKDRGRYGCFFFSSRRRHTRCYRDWSSDVCSSDLMIRRPQRCYRDWSSDVCSSDLSTRLNSREDGIRDATVTGVQTCALDRKSTRLNSSHGSISYAVSLERKRTSLNSSHGSISYAVFCLQKTKDVNT